ncbi:MAG: hypothetical protein HC915_09225 [Anaerolineae bacterium]|nr:hypothetical protein [Anaerolineae bacterium]
MPPTAKTPNYTLPADDLPTVQLTVVDDDQAGARLADERLSVREGESVTTTLTLTSQPTAPVTIEATASTPDCAAEVLGQLTAENWRGEGVQIRVSTVDDLLVQGPRECIVSLSLVSEDENYTFALETDLPVSIQNDDQPGVLLEVRNLSLVEGESARYQLRLNTQPTQPVAVDVRASLPECIVRVEGMLDASNWNTGVPVLLVIAEDVAANGTRECVLRHTLFSNEPAFNLASGLLPVVTVTVADNDEPGVVVGTRAVTQTEGRSNTYTVRLATQPTAPVTLTPAIAEPFCSAEVGGELTADNWNLGVNVTVSSVDNAQIDEARTCTVLHGARSEDPTYQIAAEDGPAVVVTLLDNDVPGLTVAPEELNLVEGESAGYTLRLNTQPQATVTVTLASDNNACVVPDPFEIVPSAWDAGAQVIIESRDNPLIDGARTCVIRHALSSAGDSSYNLEGAPLPQVTLRVSDDDRAGVALDVQALTVTEGEAETFRLSLTSQPSAPVNVQAQADQPFCQVEVSASLSALTWQDGVAVQISALDDNEINPARQCQVSFTTSSADPNYTLRADQVPGLSVAITDDDQVGGRLEPARFVLAEGASRGYRFALTAQPRTEVALSAVSDNPACLVSVQGPLTPENWQSGVLVNVALPENNQLDDYDPCQISHQLASEQLEFIVGSEALPVMEVTLEDNDQVGLVLSPERLTLTEGDEAIYSVALTSQPEDAVRLSVTSESSECRASVTESLTPDNWNLGIPVTVSISDDETPGERRTCTLQHRLESDDLAFNQPNEALPSLEVDINDNDVAGVLIPGGEVEVLEGETARLTVRLTAQPAAPVRLSVTSTLEDCEVSEVAPLTPQNWQVGVEVAVQTRDDERITLERRCELRYSTLSDDDAFRFEEDRLARTTLVIVDNDLPEVIASVDNLTLDEGSTATYTLTLSAMPSAEVSILGTTIGPCRFTLSGLLTPENWNEGLEVTVQAVDDAVFIEDNTCGLLHGAASSDPAFNIPALNGARVNVTIIENDVVGVAVEPEALTLVEGERADFRVLPRSQPAAPVTLSVTVEGIACRAEVANPVLEPPAWAEGFTVTVITIPNTTLDGERVCVVQSTLASDDPNYAAGGVVVPEVRVTVQDDDQPGVIITPLALTIREGEQAAYTVRLRSRPTAPATLNIIPGSEECQVSFPGALDAQNWQTGVTVNVQVADNTALDGERTCVIENFSLGSADPNYALPPGSLPNVLVDHCG